MSKEITITISAAGQGSRMKNSLEKAGMRNSLPKPLMPIGDDRTLIGRIIRQAQKVGNVQLFTNYDTIKTIGEHPDIPSDIQLLVNRNITGPLGPLYLDILRCKKRSFMAAGDFWAEFGWKDFIDFHNSHDSPASIIVGKSVPAKEGAKFIIERSGKVKSWHRKNKTSSNDYINIGAYILDTNDKVLELIKGFKTHKEDEFNDALINNGLLYAYRLKTKAFNVNDLDIYRQMLDHVERS